MASQRPIKKVKVQRIVLDKTYGPQPATDGKYKSSVSLVLLVSFPFLSLADSLYCDPHRTALSNSIAPINGLKGMISESKRRSLNLAPLSLVQPIRSSKRSLYSLDTSLMLALSNTATASSQLLACTIISRTQCFRLSYFRRRSYGLGAF